MIYYNISIKNYLFHWFYCMAINIPHKPCNTNNINSLCIIMSKGIYFLLWKEYIYEIPKKISISRVFSEHALWSYSKTFFKMHKHILLKYTEQSCSALPWLKWSAYPRFDFMFFNPTNLIYTGAEYYFTLCIFRISNFTKLQTTNFTLYLQI